MENAQERAAAGGQSCLKEATWAQGLPFSSSLASPWGRSQEVQVGVFLRLTDGFQHQPSSPYLPRKQESAPSHLGCRCSPFLTSPPPRDFDSHLNLISSGKRRGGGSKCGKTGKTPSHCTLWGAGCHVVADRAWLCSRQSCVPSPTQSLTLLGCKFIFDRMGGSKGLHLFWSVP